MPGQRKCHLPGTEEDWVEDNGNLRKQFIVGTFSKHLVERGNNKFAFWIQNAIKHLQGTGDAFSNSQNSVQ